MPSPKVSTYDHKPEMSAYEVTDKLVEAIGSGKYDLIVCNYANPDMVGHTGIMDAAVKAVDTIDECLGRLRAAIEKAGGVMLLTADHGNIEIDERSRNRRALYRAHHLRCADRGLWRAARAPSWKMAAWPMSRPPCWS